MTTIPTTTYGVHLTLRVSGIERRSALEGAQAISTLLTTLVKRVGMRILAGPLVGEEQGDPERRGWSGVVILYESHAAIHTYPDLGEAFIDIFSCRDFAVDVVTTMLTEFFGDYSVVEHNLFDRGIHWETDVKREMDAWLATR